MSDFNNRGLLFKNHRKRLPKHPDVVGEATLDGRKIKIAGWRKEGRKGHFYSLSFTPEQPADSHHGSEPLTSPEPDTQPQPENKPQTDNDIPF